MNELWLPGRITDMPPRVFAWMKPKATIAVFCLVLPAIVFYAILLDKAISLPLLDDYEIVLDFLNQVAERKSVAAKVSYFFSAQFNEYKLFLGHGVAWLQYALLGHLNLQILCALGNGFVLLLFFLLWKMFLPNHRDLVHRAALFIPVSWLLFQLEYVETLNWAGPSLASLPVLVFSLGAIYLLVRGTNRAFFGALGCVILAVASLANGLFVVPIGALILIVGRRFARLVWWFVVSAGCAAAYAYHYNVISSQAQVQGSVLSNLLRPRPLYVLAFVGNAAALPFGGINHRFAVFMSLVLGLLLCGFFAVITMKGYYRKNQLVSYCVLYLLLTAIGVAGLRSNFGLVQSVSSRYQIYSALLVAFAWFVIAEEYVVYKSVPLRRSRILLSAIVCSALFSLSMDAWGWSYLANRNRETVLGMAAFRNRGELNSGPILPNPNHGARFDLLVRRAPEILKQSMKLGIYRPPGY
jgi:hypothetical protein